MQPWLCLFWIISNYASEELPEKPFFFTCHKQKSFSFPGSLRVFKCKNLFKANILRLVRTHCVVMYSSVTLFVYYQVPFSLFFFLPLSTSAGMSSSPLPCTPSLWHAVNKTFPIQKNLCKTYAVSEQRRRNQTQVWRRRRKGVVQDKWMSGMSPVLLEEF